MPSSGLCLYQMIYFTAPLVTSSTRHVHKTTRRPPEDQSSWRLQVHLKHEDGLKTSWCLLQGYVFIKLHILKPNWWRLQHVMFIWPQEDHPKTSPHNIMTFTSEYVLKTSWRLGHCYVTMKLNILKPPWWRLQHAMFIRPQEDHPKTSPHDVCKWTWSMNASWRCPDAFFTVMIKLSIKYVKPSCIRLQHVIFMQEDQIDSHH